MNVYLAAGSGEQARTLVLARLVDVCVGRGATRLVLESRDPAGNALDRAVIAKTEARASGLTYDHLLPWEEPGLWVSDAVAWCYGAGGDWRRRVKPLLGEVIKLGR